MDEKNIINELIEQVPDDIKEKSLAGAVSVLGILLKEPLIEVGHLLQDKIKAKRYSNMIDIIARAKDKLGKKGVSLNEPSLKVILPLLENSSLEDDEGLKDKWSSLLRNVLDESKANDPHLSFVNILNELTPKEAQILDYLYKNYGENSFDVFESGYLIESEFGIDFENFKVYLDNFIRLAIVENILDRELRDFLRNNKIYVEETREEYFRTFDVVSKEFNINGTNLNFTYLGKALLEACAL
ncbi:Abi-alpha family protein [Paenibacillus sp. FSL W8-0186]|uniref:Abi-alpha family protein n=1 Tax=Paenibacillus sp. FSL W8-0186 TaxID=2921709 RepID=UPI0030CDBA19